jgi:hypothetical protein
MERDELTTRAVWGRAHHLEETMPAHRTVYAIYGLRVADGSDRLALEEDPGHCLNNGSVGAFWAGAYDKHMTFLAVSWCSKWPGEYVYHSGEYPNENKFVRDRWNSDLRATADRLGLQVIEEPGWFTIPSEG